MLFSLLSLSTYQNVSQLHEGRCFSILFIALTGIEHCVCESVCVCVRYVCVFVQIILRDHYIKYEAEKHKHRTSQVVQWFSL